MLLSLVYIRRLRVKKEKSLLRAHRMSVRESIETQRSLDFGVVLLKARDFLRHGKLMPFEMLRDANELKASQTLIFSLTC